MRGPSIYARVVIDFLVDDPVLLVFLVLGVGAGVGAFKVRGISFGPAAALFVGLAVGALDDALSGVTGLGLLREFGLVLFTYTVGLASGPTFLSGVKRGRGAGDRCHDRIGRRPRPDVYRRRRGARPLTCRSRRSVRREHHEHTSAAGGR